MPPVACSGTNVPAGADIQAAINAAADGTTLCLSAGVYRVANALQPKANQKLIGAANRATTIRGSKVVSGFAASGSNFVATAFLPSNPELHGECKATSPNCLYPHDVFVDGVQLTRVMDTASLVVGSFYEDYAGNKLWLRDNPSGHLVEQSVARSVIDSNVSGVTVSGMVIEHAASPGQIGVINVQTYVQSNWTVSDNEIRNSHGVGVVVDGSLIKGNHIHHIGEMGGGGHGIGLTLDGNEIDHNNTQGFNFGWEGGGVKIAWEATSVQFLNNNVHDNDGPGLWCDINVYDVIYDGNTVERNQQVGIYQEISGKAVIRNNTVRDNAFVPGGQGQNTGFYSGAQINISASPNVEVYGNTVVGANGIGIQQQRRTDTCTFKNGSKYPDGSDVCPNGYHSTINAYIHDNNITATGFAGGLSQDIGDNSFFTSKNNRYVNNTYHLPNLSGSYWAWNNTLNARSAWQAIPQDATGTFLSP